jgi:hypothetical protein
MPPFSARNQREAGSKNIHACYMLHAGFLLALFFDPDDGGDTFLGNIR